MRRWTLGPCDVPAAAMARTLIGASAAVILALPTGAAAQRPDTAALAREIPRLMEAGDIPGLAIAVIADGRPVWTGAFGMLGDEAGTPVDDRTIFSAASLSKPLFAYLVMRLVERGEFDLDRPLAELIDYPRVTHDPCARAITARLVLSHGTGLPNWGGERLELRFDPGAGFDYSGEGFVFLQRAVEAVTGLSLEELARREAFGPLGMSRSSYVWRDEFDGNAVHGKGWDARFQHVTRYDAPNAAFSLLTTAGDYARFVATVLAGDRLAERTAREMLAPVRSVHRPWRPRDADPHVSWALGWGIQAGAAGPAFWHWGDNGRFKAYVVAYPGTGTGVVYFANGDDGLSIAGAIVPMIVDDDHWALRWLDYERYDDPARLARKAVERAALEDGADAAIAAYEASRRDPATRLGVGGAGSVARFLQAHDLHDAARHVLAAAVSDHPDSAAAHANLGAALLDAGAYEDAVAAYRGALALGPNDDATRRIAWIEERIAARDTPVSVPEATLRRYVGDYGPRRVRLRDGTLYYRREGNPEYRLVPLAADLFALDGLETFRIRFAVDGDGGASAIVGLYIDGSSDREAPERGSPEFDTSGIELFWRTADRLAGGERLTESDWDALFSHPGYAVTEASGQRRSVIRHCMVAVFAPDGDVARAKENLPEGEGRRSLVGRVCDHIVAIPGRRAEIDRYVAEVAGSGLVEAGKQAAARYLPAGVIEETEAPTAYLLLFEQQGFGRPEAIVLDALLMMTRSRDQNVEFLGHEFHHAYRRVVATLDPEPRSAPLFWALDRIVNEGSASMIDKAEYVRAGSVPEGFPPEFLQLVADAPERLTAIDEALAGLEPTSEGYRAVAGIVSSNSPWGGHLNGVYMAMAIEEAFGREGVVEALTGPAAFFTAYQRAVGPLGEGRFTFSDAAISRILSLEASSD